MKAETRIRRSLALAAVAAASLAMAASVARVPAAQARAGAIGGSSSPTVNVWITTANGQQKLSQQASGGVQHEPPFDYGLPGDSLATFVWVPVGRPGPLPVGRLRRLG